MSRSSSRPTCSCSLWYPAMATPLSVTSMSHGLYFEDSAEAKPCVRDGELRGIASYALDPAAAERLWEVSLATLG